MSGRKQERMLDGRTTKTQTCHKSATNTNCKIAKLQIKGSKEHREARPKVVVITKEFVSAHIVLGM